MKKSHLSRITNKVGPESIPVKGVLLFDKKYLYYITTAMMRCILQENIV